MGDKFPTNRGGYSGKYSGSAGRSYSSSRAQMSRGGGGKGPVNPGGGGKKDGCPLFILIWVVAPLVAAALYRLMILDSLYRL